jgi:hypothetical protein
MSSTAGQPQGWEPQGSAQQPGEQQSWQQQHAPQQPPLQPAALGQGPFQSAAFAPAPFAPAPHWAPQAAPAQWSAPTHPGPKTNLLALLSIIAAATGATILLGVGSIAAIVMGSMALAQIRRTGDDGRLLALWAVIVGAVTLLALTFATVIGVASFVQFVEQMRTTGF